NVAVSLPAVVENQPQVQLRWITTDAVGADEWVGIDDICVVCGNPTSPWGTGGSSPPSVVPGDPVLLTVNVTPGANPQSSGLLVTANLNAIGGPANQTFYDDGTHG